MSILECNDGMLLLHHHVYTIIIDTRWDEISAVHKLSSLDIIICSINSEE